MHYYQFNIGDYVKDTQHLSEMEDLAYRRMIDLYYLRERCLPDSVEEIARLIRMRTHTECIAIVLQEFFVRIADGYANNRVEREISNFKSKSEKARKSAESRWSKNNNLQDANALRTQCDGNANHKPITNNQEPIEKNKTRERKSADFLPPDNLNLEAWQRWVEFRKAAKFKAYQNNAQSAGRAMANLIKLAGGNESAQMQIVEQSMNNNWQGLFQLRQGFQKRGIMEISRPDTEIPEGFE